MTYHDIVIIGAGPAGLAAAIGAREAGVEDILLLERDNAPGGILNQCIHNGFGLHTFNEELTGPEYAQRFIDRVEELGIPIQLGTMVLDISPDRVLTCTSRENGLEEIRAGAVILCMGCRERPRGAMDIPGSRPAGIYSAGTAQRLVNVEGFMPGKEVFIMGSGDVGLIMARRMTLEGAVVKGVCNRSSYSSGLKRNVVQCLDDFGIPLMVRHTVTEIHGRERLEGVTVSEVGEDKKPIPGTGQFIKCDTLLFSVGLVPENELSEQAGVELDEVTGGPVVTEQLATSIPGVFACGSVLHVHDLVDYVSAESEQAGRSAAAYLHGIRPEGSEIRLVNGFDVGYTVPQHIHRGMDSVEIFFRVRNVRKDTAIRVTDGEKQIARFKREHMAPGEMENIRIPKVLLDRIVGDTLTVEIEEAPAAAAERSGHTTKE